ATKSQLPNDPDRDADPSAPTPTPALDVTPSGNPDLLEQLTRQRQIDTELLILRAVRSRLLALELLESAAPETKDPIEKRKLAIAITRATNLRGLVGAAPIAPADAGPSGPHHPRPSKPEALPSLTSPPAPRPRRTPTESDVPEHIISALRPPPPEPKHPDPGSPTPTDSAVPEHIISALRASLKEPKDPDPGSDIATLRAHMSPDAIFNGVPIPKNHTDFADLFNQSPLALAREHIRWTHVAAEAD